MDKRLKSLIAQIYVRFRAFTMPRLDACFVGSNPRDSGIFQVFLQSGRVFSQILKLSFQIITSILIYLLIHFVILQLSIAVILNT